MGLFEKKYCELCNNSVNLLTRLKLSDGFLCSACRKKLSSFSSNWGRRTIDDVKQHLAAREQNRQKFAQFQRTAGAGPNSELVVDANHRWFYFAYGADYREQNPEVFNFDQLVDFYITEDYEFVSSRDSDGDGVPDSQDAVDNRTGQVNQARARQIAQQTLNANALNLSPQLQMYVRRESNAYDSNTGQLKPISGLNLYFKVNHPYIDEIRIDVNTSDYNLMQTYQQAAQVMQLCEQIRGGNPAMGQMGMQAGMVQPGMAYPAGMVQPGMAYQTGMVQPGMVQPGMVQPGMVQPGMVQPGMVQPGMVQPGMVQPGMVQPGMVQPGMVQPGMVQPSMVQPGMAYQQAGMGYQQAGMAAACPFCGAVNSTGSLVCPSCGGAMQR